MSEAPRELPSADDWKALERLMDVVLDAPPGERSELIARLCDRDLVLQAELERLVREGEEPDPRLDGPIGDLVATIMDDDTPPALKPLAVLADRFRIEREIGRGGMAVVYLARDLKHERDVAVKVMRRTHAAGPQRFATEIKLTANLRHPHIVPLYDSGDAEDCVFFVMPYIEGESVRARLDRQGSLATAEAVSIASHVASALEFAHARGVIHRDVKPSNILLSGTEALLADFGIARGVTSASDSLTDAGMIVGTLNYMSPEQMAGQRQLDARSDLYSLGCVLYEMLSGEPPTPASTRVDLARHSIDPIHSLRTRRPAVHEDLARCVSRAVALDPAERFTSAADFARALAACPVDDASAAPISRPSRRRWWVGRASVVTASVVLVVAFGMAAWFRFDRLTGVGAPGRVGREVGVSVDTTRYVLMPFSYGTGVTKRVDERQLLVDAMRRWDGITIVDPIDATLPSGTTNAAAWARNLGAGRYVRGEVSAPAGELRIRATAYDAATGQPVNEATVRLTPHDSNADSVYGELADGLLLTGVPTRLRTGATVGTRSRPALQAFANGRAAIERWDLARAEAQFDAAARYDYVFAQSYLWLAQTRMWREAPPETWHYAANRAADGRERLSKRDQTVVDALLAYGEGDLVGAYRRWARIARQDKHDFAAWYSSALCLLKDSVVVRDPASPSHWRFRSSYQRAATSFDTAFQILPVVYQEFRASWFWNLRTLLSTSPTRIRAGHALPPDTGVFVANPSWAGDTLAFVPYRVRDVELGLPATLPASHAEAIRKQRQMVRRIAATWRAAFPRSSDAMLALALASDDLGDPGALDSLRVARQLATDSGERLRAGAAEVWVEVKRSVPRNLDGLNAARVLADSLVSQISPSDVRQSDAVASLAALTGRLSAGVAAARHFGPTSDPSTRRLIEHGRALQVFAALGGPQDSIRALERAVEDDIQQSVGVAMREGAQVEWRLRAMTLAFPTWPSPRVRDFASIDDLARAQASSLQHDTATVLRVLDSLRIRRRVIAPEVLKLEALYPEASLLRAVGARADAVQWVGPTLESMEKVSPQALSTAIGTASLVRSMILRAELAEESGDHRSAAMWARAVVTLWANADPSLQPVVERMKRLF